MNHMWLMDLVNVAFLVALAFAVAASANLPTILYSLYWKRFNTRGALWSMYGGLISCIVLIVLSPAVLALCTIVAVTVILLVALCGLAPTLPVLVAAFHPELTADRRLQRLFVEMTKEERR